MSITDEEPSCYGTYPFNAGLCAERGCADCPVGEACLAIAREKLPQKPPFLMVIDKGEPHHTIPMILFCPNGHRHIDEEAFETVPHHTHACQECGIVWRPAKVNTHGVQFLPGYKNGD